MALVAARPVPPTRIWIVAPDVTANVPLAYAPRPPVYVPPLPPCAPHASIVIDVSHAGTVNDCVPPVKLKSIVPVGAIGSQTHPVGMHVSVVHGSSSLQSTGVHSDASIDVVSASGIDD